MMSQLNSIQAPGQGNIHTVVDEDPASAPFCEFESSAGEFQQRLSREVFFPDLYEIDGSVDGLLDVLENREGAAVPIGDVVSQRHFISGLAEKPPA